ncbi:hypothetical protein BpHYR1_032830 [Brachionus plicatilis]|uniref:Uncharacterized protein n=1 Tax=Brachionus plicatilis TaxID=10195 RepID=A0A3M7QNS9_BRAPC|nr:hypothetical protein BpHYR1_032830 [Brachionus plicatilis]
MLGNLFLKLNLTFRHSILNKVKTTNINLLIICKFNQERIFNFSYIKSKLTNYASNVKKSP